MTFGLLLALAVSAFGAAAPVPADPKALYDAGRYAEAAAVWRSELARDPYNAALHYNLGGALLKAKAGGPAIASYLRAFELTPRDEDIRFNLDFALRRAGDSLYPDGVPRGLWIAFHALSMVELEALHWLLLWVALLAAAACALKENLRQALTPILTAAVLGWAVMAGWWALRAAAWPRPLAVTVSAQTELRNGPGDTFSVGFTAPEGHRVRILEDRGEWLEVGLLKEGVKGWVRKEDLESL